MSTHQISLQAAADLLGVSYQSLKKKPRRARLGLEDCPRPIDCIDLRLTFVTMASAQLAKARIQKYK